MTLQNSESKLEAMRTKTLEAVQKSISALMDEVMQEFRAYTVQMQEFSKSMPVASTVHPPSTNSIKRSATATSADRKLVRREKTFMVRESLLTSLLQIDHMHTVRNLFYIVYFIFAVNGLFYESRVEGRIQFGLDLIGYGFGKFHYALIAWMFENAIVILLYYMFQAWSSIRLQLHRNKSLQRLWSLGCLWVYVGCQLVVLYVGCSVCFKYELPFASALALQLETVRLMMKMQAFVRTNAARLLSQKLIKSDLDEDSSVDSRSLERASRAMTPFSSYLYFLFAPTLVYRDEYPRTSRIRWTFAIKRLLEIVAIVFLVALTYKRFVRNEFVHFGSAQWDLDTFLQKILAILPTTMAMWMCMFYLLQHAWFNFMAELLRFGDRLFYTGWWNASNYDDYYRQWNTPVHDFLYQYVYRDCYEFVCRGSKSMASLAVFTLSAIFHEIIMGCTLRMFFPVLYLFFGVIGVFLVAFTRICSHRAGQLMLWFGTVVGSATMVSLYCSEYYARWNVPLQPQHWSDHFIPHIMHSFRSGNPSIL